MYNTPFHIGYCGLYFLLTSLVSYVIVFGFFFHGFFHIQIFHVNVHVLVFFVRYNTFLMFLIVVGNSVDVVVFPGYTTLFLPGSPHSMGEYHTLSGRIFPCTFGKFWIFIWRMLCLSLYNIYNLVMVALIHTSFHIYDLFQSISSC